VRPSRVADAMADAIGFREQPALPDDPVDAIRRLGELRDAGLISPAEFEAKRAELLARI
jgi:hypothetical protein